MDGFHLLFSYQDLKLILNILDVIKKDSETVVNPEEPDPEEDLTQSELDLATKSQKTKPKAASKKNVTDEYLKIKAKDIRFTIIDDLDVLENIPLLDLIVEEVNTDVADWSSGLGVISKISAKINYFNDKVQKWEPLVEYLTFEAKFIIDDQEKEAALLMEETLNINVTGAFIDTMLRVGQSWNDDQKKEEGNSKQTPKLIDKRGKLGTYYFQNLTGEHLSYQMGNENAELSDNSRVVLNVPTNTLALNKTKRLPLKMSFQLKGFPREVKNIPLDQTGNFTLRLNNKDETNKVIYDVAFRRGSAYITLRSPVTIKNDTQVPLSILMESPTSKPFEVPKLEPGETYSLPLRFARDGRIQVRPAGASYFCESWIDHFTHGLNGLLRCQTQPPKIPFYFKYFIDLHSPQNPQDFVVHIYPPIEVENLLCHPIEYQIVDLKQANHTLSSGKAKRGETFAIHSMTAIDAVGGLFKIPGSKFSTILKLAADEVSKFFQVFDDHGRELRILIDNRISKNGVRTVSLYTKYWMINKTGMRILYGNKGGEIVCAGQSKEQTKKKTNFIIEEKNKLQCFFYCLLLLLFLKKIFCFSL